jgi:hypothetical protein
MKLTKSVGTAIDSTIQFVAVVLALGVLGSGLGFIASFIFWPLLRTGTGQDNYISLNLASGGFWIGALIGVPIAFCVVLRALANAQRRDRVRGGRCISCGYDLSGNVSGVCPECGERK